MSAQSKKRKARSERESASCSTGNRTSEGSWSRQARHGKAGRLSRGRKVCPGGTATASIYHCVAAFSWEKFSPNAASKESSARTEKHCTCSLCLSGCAAFQPLQASEHARFGPSSFGLWSDFANASIHIIVSAPAHDSRSPTHRASQCCRRQGGKGAGVSARQEKSLTHGPRMIHVQ